MNLSEAIAGAPDLIVRGVAYDSRKIEPGFAFVAMPRVPEEKAPGNHRDGHDFVGVAAERGASVAIVERPVAVDVAQVVVPNSRQALADLAVAFHGRPAEKLRLIGITGTDGKTTTVQLASQLLELDGHSSGFATTTDFKVGGRQWENLSRQTTVEALEIQELLHDMAEAGCSHALLEATSQGLEQERLRGCAFAVAAFTNVTSDRMDWHKTQENYLAAKRRLFEQLKPSGIAVLNEDDPNASYFRQAVSGAVLRYGSSAAADFRAENVRYVGHALGFRLSGPDGAADIQMSLLGRFNVMNALAAAAIVYAEGMPFQAIAEG